MSFGNKLKYLRKKNNLTQIELAKILNKSRSTIAGYEIDDRQPDLDTLEKIAEYFNVSTDYLLDRTNIPNPTDEKLIYIQPNGIPVTLKEIVNAFIDAIKKHADSPNDFELSPQTIDDIIDSVKSTFENNNIKKLTE